MGDFKVASPALWYDIVIYNNNNLLHLYSAFLGTQSALHSNEGISSSTTSVQHPPDDVTAAIVRQNTPHTPAYWWRGDSDEVNQCMGMIRRPWWSEASGEVCPGCRGHTATLFLMTTESQDLGLTSHPKDGYDMHTLVFW